MLRDILTTTHEWFEKAVPTPTSKNQHTQLGCHLEEVNEMMMLLQTRDFETSVLIDTVKMALNNLANHLKTNDEVVFVEEKDREEFLDAFCDQIVTGVGCAYMFDMDILNGMVEVNRSNFSKFDENGEPIFDENMKVKKGPDFTKANHAGLV